MPVTREQLVALQSACFADDLELTESMLSWTASEARRYFESGGQDTPGRAEATLAMLDAYNGVIPARVYASGQSSGTWRWPEGVYEVLHSPRVAIRAEPSTSAQVIGLVPCGEQVVAAAVEGSWLRLFGGDGAGFVLIDGRCVGLGTLLRRVPAPWLPLTPAHGLEAEPAAIRADDPQAAQYAHSPLAPALLPAVVLSPPSPLSAGLRSGAQPARAHLVARLLAQRGVAVCTAGVDAELLSQAADEVAAMREQDGFQLFHRGETVDAGATSAANNGEYIRGDVVLYLSDYVQQALKEPSAEARKAAGGRVKALSRVEAVMHAFGVAVLRELEAIEPTDGETGGEAGVVRAAYGAHGPLDAASPASPAVPPMAMCRDDAGRPLKYTSRTDMMISCYPGAAANYRAHIDSVSTGDQRCLTCLLYLNEEWNAAVDGGALRVYPPVVFEGEALPGCSACVDISPRAGTMVLFRADKVLHEVRPAHRPRYACSMWFRAESDAVATPPAG